jgi:hypothetical protein
MSGVLDHLRRQARAYLAKAAATIDETQRKRYIMLAAHCQAMMAERADSGFVSDAGPITPASTSET